MLQDQQLPWMRKALHVMTQTYHRLDLVRCNIYEASTTTYERRTREISIATAGDSNSRYEAERQA